MYEIKKVSYNGLGIQFSLTRFTIYFSFIFHLESEIDSTINSLLSDCPSFLSISSLCPRSNPSHFMFKRRKLCSSYEMVIECFHRKTIRTLKKQTDLCRVLTMYPPLSKCFLHINWYFIKSSLTHPNGIEFSQTCESCITMQTPIAKKTCCPYK